MDGWSRACWSSPPAATETLTTLTFHADLGHVRLESRSYFSRQAPQTPVDYIGLLVWLVCIISALRELLLRLVEVTLE